MFRDTAPHHRMPEPTRAECAAADEAFAQGMAAQAGRTCYDMADAIASLLDCHDSEWSADAQPALDELHALLVKAAALAGVATAYSPEE